MKIDHLGIAVSNLDEAISRWKALGFEIQGTETVVEQRVRVAMFPAGESRIELLETTDPEGPVGKFISKRGEGLHHVAFGVGDIESTLAELKKKGVRLIDETPRPGAGGALIAFVHPSNTGMLIEICERPANEEA